MATYLVKLESTKEVEVEADSYTDAIHAAKRQLGAGWDFANVNQIWPARSKAVKRG